MSWSLNVENEATFEVKTSPFGPTKTAAIATTLGVVCDVYSNRNLDLLYQVSNDIRWQFRNRERPEHDSVSQNAWGHRLDIIGYDERAPIQQGARLRRMQQHLGPAGATPNLDARVTTSHAD
jgi:hypothetical protein